MLHGWQGDCLNGSRPLLVQIPCLQGHLEGSLRVPGDKSIAHRALILAAISEGRSVITGLGDGGDNRSTARVLRQMGVRIESEGETTVVHGVGLKGLKPSSAPLDCGNSGTTMRLLLGVLAGQPFEVDLVGDHSLSRRPMARVLDPLRQMGLEVLAARDDDYPPLKVRGRTQLESITYHSPVASAQIKSALLLADLWASGESVIHEPALSRDHTERMLEYMGRPPTAGTIHVPGDLSSAAFLMTAALLRPGSKVTLRDVGVNPTRTGFLDVLDAMGAQIELMNPRESNGEPRADLVVVHQPLRGVEVSGALTVRAIDELPLVATLAARATGTTRIRDAAELRVKESDRIARMVQSLRSFGVQVDEHPDGMTVHGRGVTPLTAGQVEADGDHRVAMCGTLLGMNAEPGTMVSGIESVSTSFPGFFESVSTLSTTPWSFALPDPP